MAKSAKRLPLPATVAGLLLASTAGVVAAWFMFSAWKLASTNRGLVAVILLLTGSILAVTVTLLRSRGQPVAGEADVSAVYDHLHRLELALRVIRNGRGVMGLLCAGLACFWLVEWMALAKLLQYLVPSSIICAVTACLYLPWLRSAERRLGEQRAAILQRLKDLKEKLLQA
jgi:hypothetical protein